MGVWVKWSQLPNCRLLVQHGCTHCLIISSMEPECWCALHSKGPATKCMLQQWHFPPCLQTHAFTTAQTRAASTGQHSLAWTTWLSASAWKASTHVVQSAHTMHMTRNAYASMKKRRAMCAFAKAALRPSLGRWSS